MKPKGMQTSMEGKSLAGDQYAFNAGHYCWATVEKACVKLNRIQRLFCFRKSATDCGFSRAFWRLH